MRYIAALFAALATIASARADIVKLPVQGGAGGEHFEYQCADNGYLHGEPAPTKPGRRTMIASATA